MKTSFPVHTRRNLALSLILAISLVGISYGAGGVLPGDGLSESTAYLIEDLADFDVFADQANAATYWASGVHTKLTCDPNLAGRIYATAVIAPDTSTNYDFQGTLFAGVFDGNSHVIRNLTIDTAGAGNDFLGLFGKIEGSGAEIRNLGLENVNITGGNDSCVLGGLCGFNSYGTITNCYADGPATGDNILGGLCGFNSYGTITNCYADGAVTGDGVLGGLCGSNVGTITNCYATSSVTGGADSRYIGGLCGNNEDTITNCSATGAVTGGIALGGLCGWNNRGTITNCYATGAVTGDGIIGGLCGSNYWYATITNSYATGVVTGDSRFGGLCGDNYKGTITNCFWDVETSGITDGVGNQDPDPVGVIGKTTAQMQTESTFTDASWDFDVEPLWKMPFYESGYPILAWQWNGDGSQEKPYLIENMTDFDVFADPANSATYWSSGVYTKLACDPNLTGRPYTTAVIAPDTPDTGSYFDGIPFEGIFDGNDHIIRNLTIDTTGAGNDYLGLFGRIEGSSAKVKNLGIENINITGGDNSYSLGGLCGFNYYGTITNCYTTGPVTGRTDSDYLGGLCGRNYKGTITNCYATGSVTGYDHLGGLCGRNYKGTITNCYATGSVTGDDLLGGLCGGNYGTITNCYASGVVTGDDELGGLCGYNYTGTITNCYAAGPVTGNGRLGGLCGFSCESTITNCYATGAVTGDDLLGGLSGDNWHGTIANCYAIGLVTGDDMLGGLFGYNSYGTIINCYATGSVIGRDNSYSLGGLCGGNLEGTITNCYATGSVIGGDNSYSFGGLCGSNVVGPITNCYATGSVIGGDDSYLLGGLCGRNEYSIITNCYTTGSVTGGNDSYALGGLCGYNRDGTITNCFWDVETSGIGIEGDDNDGATGKTTEQMQTESTFTDANWDFIVVPVWHMPFQAVGYPMLGWQKDIPGDFTGRYGVYMDDFAIFSYAWLSDDTPTANWNGDCDLDASGVIDTGDLKIFAEHWLCD